jgi:hypothetical protein
MTMAVKIIPAPYVPINPAVVSLFETLNAVQSYIPAVIALKFPPDLGFPVVLAGTDPPVPTSKLFSQ